MLPVETPFKTYTGLDGKPLNNGYVYFGVPNQNPLTAPVTVYWDAAGTQPAAQPLRTVNGYIIRAGTPANVFAAGAYSELVKDSKSKQVFYARTSDDFSAATLVSTFLSSLVSSVGSSLIGFIQTGFGAVMRTVQGKLRDTVGVTDFGADASGVADSLAAFNNAPDGAMVPAGTYKLTAHITGKTFYTTGDVTLTGAGSANIVNLLDVSNGGFSAIDESPYPATTLDYKSEPALVVTNSGKIIAVYRIGQSHVNGATNVTSYLVYKTYDKKTGIWTNFQTLDSQVGFDTRNQVVGISELTGRIFALYVQNQYDGAGNINAATRKTYLKYSDDNGSTWSARIDISQYCPYPGLDNVPFGKVITFADGSLMVSLYNYKTIITLRSTDNGATWGHAFAGGDLPNINPNMKTVYTTPIASDDNITEPTLVKLSERNIVCIARCITSGVVADGAATMRFVGKKWVTATRYEVDMYAYMSSKLYRCTVAGTSGGVAPSHAAGTAVDGSVTWVFVDVYTAWVGATAVTAGVYIETYSAYLYQVAIAGVTGAVAPFYSMLSSEEPQMAYFKSDNGGETWSAATKVTWTDATYKITNSPPTAVVVGGTVHIAWFARSPEWALYYVKMSARAFFENPSWAFSKTDGEPRSRLMRSFLFAQANNYGLRVDCGYVSLAKMPNSRDVMAAWYDNTGAHVNPYSTIVQA